MIGKAGSVLRNLWLINNGMSGIRGVEKRKKV